MTLPKVLMVGPALSGGGAEGRFSRVASHVTDGKADVAVLVFDPRWHFDGQGRVIDLRWRSTMSYPRIIVTLARHIRRERYDVVMGFGVFPNLVTAMAARLSMTGVRVVVHEITRPIKMLEKASVLRRLFYWNLQRSILSRTDVMTANSIDGLAELLEICSAFQGLSRRLDNAIDIDSLGTRLDSAPPPPTLLPTNYIASVARLDYMKRVDTVIDALEKLSSRSDVALVVVGDGEALCSLKKKAMAAGLSDKVIFTGRMSNPLGVVRGARALIMPSEYEGFSNTILEAMVIGTPVISSYCNSDVRDMEELGAILGFEVGDSEMLADHILDTIEGRTDVKALKKTAFSYAKKHAITSSIQRYNDVLIAASEMKR